MSMRKVIWIFLVGLLGLVALSGCETGDLGEPPSGPVPMSDIQVPDGFKFANRVDHELCLELVNVNGDPYAGVVVNVATAAGEDLTEGQTGPDGRINLVFSLAAEDVAVLVSTPAIGLVTRDTTLVLEEVSTCAVIR